MPFAGKIIEPLWDVALNDRMPIARRFQAACALATFAPLDEQWADIASMIANQLVNQQTSEFLVWRAALRPAKAQLIEPLGLIYRDHNQNEQARIYAAEALVDYASDQPKLLFELLADAEPFQFQTMFAKLAAYRDRAVTIARQEVARIPPDDASEAEKEALAKRQANAAVALYRLGDYGTVWPLLKFSPDPRVRSYVIHWLPLLGGNPQPLVKQFDIEADVTIRRARTADAGRVQRHAVASVAASTAD